MPGITHSERIRRYLWPVTRPRRPALSDSEITILERRVRLSVAWHDYDLVFAAEMGTPIGPRNLGSDFETWVAWAGVPAIRIHDIRHTVVTQAIASGSSIKAVSQHVGHAQTSITLDIYARVLPHQRAEVAQKRGQAFLDETTESAERTEGAESED